MMPSGSTVFLHVVSTMELQIGSAPMRRSTHGSNTVVQRPICGSLAKVRLQQMNRHLRLTRAFGSRFWKECIDVRSCCCLPRIATDRYRTTVIDECLRRTTRSTRSVILFYFYRATERTAKAFFANLLKQLLASLIDTRVPCPPTIREEIEHAFGLENSQPDLGGLVADIIIPLLSKFETGFVILDGLDLCNEKEQREIWKHLRKIIESCDHRCRVRVVFGSQDHKNFTDRLPNTKRLRMDFGSSVKDIDVFIDDQLSSHSGNGQLLENDSLRAEVKRLLKEKANGM
jgi:hypothetical protein